MNFIQPEIPAPVKPTVRIKKKIYTGFSLGKRHERKLRKIKEAQLKQRKNINKIPQKENNTSKSSENGSFEIGRWKVDEHERFVHALINYGNDWKQVQKYVRTRSSTQARSHAQKFFIKIKKADILPFTLDLSKASIQMLHDLVSEMNAEQYNQMMQELNDVAFDRKTGGGPGKRKKLQPKVTNPTPLTNHNTDTTENENVVQNENENENLLLNQESAPNNEDDFFNEIQNKFFSRKNSNEFIQKKRRHKNSINSIEGYFENSDYEDENYKSYGLEDQAQSSNCINGINEREYINNFNLAFRNDIPNRFDNFRLNSSRKVSLEDDYIYNYQKQ